MFINAILGNVTYGMSLFLRINSWEDLVNKVNAPAIAAHDLLFLIHVELLCLRSYLG